MNDIVERAIKGWVTSLLGLALMVYALYDWREEYLTDFQAIGLACFGLLLVFVKDKIPEYLGRFFSAILDKFFPPKPKP